MLESEVQSTVQRSSGNFRSLRATEYIQHRSIYLAELCYPEIVAEYHSEDATVAYVHQPGVEEGQILGGEEADGRPHKFALKQS